MAYYGKRTKSDAFHGNPPKSARKVANNTFRWEDEDGSIKYRLHQTDVVTIRPDGKVVLDSGGWKSVTTKDRMHLYAKDYSIWSIKGQWFVRGRGADFEAPPVAYYDGMVLPDALNDQAASRDRNAEQKALAKKIAKYAKLYCEQAVPIPNGGDCWHCLMKGKDGVPLGDMSGNTEHLLSHIEEGYVFGSLLANAFLFAGYRPEQLRYIWGMGDRPKRVVQRYLRHKLGLAY